jgi:molybdopterin-guanine dinucleotide biosynthesis protein A
MKAYILAGGESSRMKTNKAFLDINGNTLIESIANQLLTFDEVVIVGKKEVYQHLSYRVIEDIEIGKGPLSGIHTALKDAENRCFICTCDSPILLKEFFISESGIFNLNGESLFFPMITDKEDLLSIELLLSGKDWSIKNYLKTCSKQIHHITSSQVFWNLNTPSKYNNYLESIS